MSEMTDQLQEIRSSNRFILKRLNQIVSGQAICTCPCHNRDSNTEIDTLKQRINYLEEQEIIKEDQLKALRKQFQTFKDSFETIHRSSSLLSPKLGDDASSSQQEIIGCTAVSEYTTFHGANLDYNAETKTTAVLQVHIDVNERNSPTMLNVHTDTVRRYDDQNINTENSEIENDNEENDIPKAASSDEEADAPNDISKEDRVISDSDIKQTDEYLLDTDDKDVHKSHTLGEESKPSVSASDNQENSAYKTNFRKVPLSESLGVKVIEQTVRRMIDLADWHIAAAEERLQGQMSGLATLRGVFTVVCVDISYSMTQGNAWEQAKTFFTDLIEGLKESMHRYNVTAENVALVTFGHKTEVLKRFTNDFTSLQTAFDGISLGGPSPMYGGLLMSTAAAQSALGYGGATVNGIPVLTKVVLITDGYLTDTKLVAGPDELSPSEQEQTRFAVVEIMQKMEGNFEIFCVPVGDSNSEFLELLTSVSDGKVLTYRDGKKVGTRTRKTLLAGGGMPFASIGNDSDEEDIKDIIETAAKRSNKMEPSYYVEISTEKLPKIGTRVRRGPDWMWSNQDDEGPGTVVGHTLDGYQVWVEWDRNSDINTYRYDPKLGYDVLIVDEPRMPKPDGRLAVGCIVKPSHAWKHTTKNVKMTDKGVVIKIQSAERVQVRWENKEKGDYSYGLDGIFEVEFCPPEEVTSPEVQGAQGFSTQSTRSQYYVPSKPAGQPTKNKNKNIQNIQNKNIVNKNETIKK